MSTILVLLLNSPQSHPLEENSLSKELCYGSQKVKCPKETHRSGSI